MTSLLDRERETLDRYLPDLERRLNEIEFEDLEGRGSPAIEMFREAGGPALLVPIEHGGRGVSALEAVQIQCAVGARSPSLAVASTMHHFSIASLVGMDKQGVGFEWMLLESIAEGSRLVASGFAEGTTGQSVFAPNMTARRVSDGYRVNGTKKPCSLAYSMDLLSASVEIVGGKQGDETYAVAVIASELPGISIEPFWNAPVLAGAQSEAVILRDVSVDERLVVSVGTVKDGHLTSLQSKAFLWFGVLMTASYLGMASSLVEYMLQEDRGDRTLRVSAAIELEAAMSAIEGVACRIDEDQHDPRVLARALSCRYAAQDAIARAVATAVEQLGGIAFIRDPKVAYIAGASRALGFHPPSRSQALPALADVLKGKGFDLS